MHFPSSLMDVTSVKKSKINKSCLCKTLSGNSSVRLVLFVVLIFSSLWPQFDYRRKVFETNCGKACRIMCWHVSKGAIGEFVVTNWSKLGYGRGRSMALCLVEYCCRLRLFQAAAYLWHEIAYLFLAINLASGDVLTTFCDIIRSLVLK